MAQPQKRTPIALDGEGIAFDWTKRALERRGFVLEESAKFQVKIQEKPRLWKVLGGSRHVDLTSIAELLGYLSESK